MARGSQQASTAATSAQNLSNTYSGNANALFGALEPMLVGEAAHPAGIDPTTMARMDTAAAQTAGGANAGAVGQAGLRSARMRNAGGGDAAVAESGRRAGETLSRGILGNRLRSSELQQQQRRSALSGLEGLFGANLGGSNAALGEVAQNVNANTQAENASWDWAKDLFVPLAESGARVATARLGGNP